MPSKLLGDSRQYRGIFRKNVGRKRSNAAGVEKAVAIVRIWVREGNSAII